jgi:hypothetical protein
MEQQRKAAREYLHQVGMVLHTEWNPIGGDVPRDEYDAYAGPVASLLLKNAPDEEIAAYLDHVEGK